MRLPASPSSNWLPRKSRQFADGSIKLIEGIDQLRELRTSVGLGFIMQDTRVIYHTDPAALILPIVERIAPERLAEVFWRAPCFIPGSTF